MGPHTGDPYYSYGGITYAYNTAAGRGGAIYTDSFYEEGDVAFEGNTASSGGALFLDDAIYVDWDGAFVNNSAGSGDLAYLVGASAELVTFSAFGNQGAGTVYVEERAREWSVPDGTRELYCYTAGCSCLPTICP